ncbi:MAG TPA: substrate-binding domain-containing protein [Chthoniobacteraceae bacterium]|nr:substrate-binding domain-containing protein [Chthoniobacteraceae bacterium]
MIQETQPFLKRSSETAVERVKNHLEQVYLGPRARTGVRLPPVRSLARKLSVSSATLLKAIRQLEASGQLATRGGSGVFIAERPETAFGNRCITLATTWPDEPNRWTHIYSQTYQQAIARAGVQNGRRVSLLPLGSAKWSQKQTLERLIEERSFVDGLLILPLKGYQDHFRKVAEAYREAGKPVVSFWPLTRLSTRNFVGLDSIPTARDAVRSLAAAGRRHLLLLLQGSIVKSYYESQIFLGAHLGAEEAGGGCRLSVEVCTDDEEIGGTLEKYDGKRAPRLDGVLTAGHFQALTAFACLKKQGYAVPGDVSLLTLSHLGETYGGEVHLSGMLNPYEEMGERLVSMMLKRLHAPGDDQPGEYIAMNYHAGETTGASENAFLREEKVEASI